MMLGYAHRIAAAYASGTIDRGGAWSITVAHDPECAELRKVGACSCRPDITARNLATDVVVHVGLSGETLATERAS